MDIKEYGKIVCDFLDQLNDEEFDNLLLRSGIEKCPIEKTYKDYSSMLSETISSEEVVKKHLYHKTSSYLMSKYNNHFVCDLKVA